MARILDTVYCIANKICVIKFLVRRRERHPGGGRRPRHPGPGEEEAGPGSRGSSFKRSVTGLVRKVSQKVARDTKGGSH